MLGASSSWWGGPRCRHDRLQRLDNALVGDHPRLAGHLHSPASRNRKGAVRSVCPCRCVKCLSTSADASGDSCVNTTSTGGSSPTTGSSSTTASTPSSTTASSSPSSSSSPSVVPIIAGIVAAVIAVAVITGVLLYMRKRNAAAAAKTDPNMQPVGYVAAAPVGGIAPLNDPYALSGALPAPLASGRSDASSQMYRI